MADDAHHLSETDGVRYGTISAVMLADIQQQQYYSAALGVYTPYLQPT